MSNKSNNRAAVSLEYVGGLNKRERIWAKIRANKTFSASSISIAVKGISKSSVHHYLKCLLAGGYIAQEPNIKPVMYKLVNDCGIDAPRLRKDGTAVTQGVINENLWRTMKILKTFDWMDLSRVASTEATVVKPDTAKHYIDALYKGGYLMVMRESNPGTRAVYRFNSRMNTGNRAPKIMRDKSLYDPNLDRIVYKTGDV